MLTPSFVVFALSYYMLAGLGVNLGYHRVLSHRSLKLPWSAKHWLGPNQFDWTWLVIRGLRVAGLAKGYTPSELKGIA